MKIEKTENGIVRIRGNHLFLCGFIAFILDLADKKWDDYLTIKFA